MASLRVYSDPLQHAAIAAAVAAPLVPRAGRGVLVTAVAVATLIDVDHAIAARSLRVARDHVARHASAQPQPRSPRSRPAAP